MGKRDKKTGAGRLDKFYHMAKSQGYRARSAFKLVQLNKRYDLLTSARCCIDLCAAPGGWLQVAAKYMPQNSIIVGVDLVAIKPIPRCTTFATDITTTECRNLIRGELKTWKADLVLHDGAPNVGAAWVQDAFSQSELVLCSLKLATEFLAEGGNFVTKVFRSKDYNNLMWVFGKLFSKVEATKPPSSRNVSAEIFVVCRGYLNPKVLDPKLLDPREVFKDLADLPASLGGNAEANVFHPEKHRKRREGYEDGNLTLHKTIPVEDWVRVAETTEAITVLGTYNAMSFDTEESKAWKSLEVTTKMVLANLADLKVLGKSDFKSLLKWRLAIRKQMKMDVEEPKEIVQEVVSTEPIDEDAAIEEELERLNEVAMMNKKRERRKTNEKRTKQVERLQLGMQVPHEIGLTQQDLALEGQEDTFQLRDATDDLGADEDMDKYESEDDLDVVSDENSDDELINEAEIRQAKLDAELDAQYEGYKDLCNFRDAKYRAREARRKDKKMQEWGGIRVQEDQEGSEDEGEGGYDILQNMRNRDARSDSESDSDGEEARNIEDENEDAEPMSSKKRKRIESSGLDERPRNKLINKMKPEATVTRAEINAKVWFDQPIFAASGISALEDEIESDEETLDVEMEGHVSDNESVANSIVDADDASDDDFEIVPALKDDGTEWDVDDEDQDLPRKKRKEEFGLLTDEAVSIAHRLVNRQTTVSQLINDGFNKHHHNDKGELPEWFLDDESKHYKPNIPITKEAAAMLKEKQRALDARPIKKIAEAKMRKKFKAAQRATKIQKKAEGMMDADMSEKEKSASIAKMMAKGSAAPKRREVKVVVATGTNRGNKGRPKGVKGRYKMVDPRMRKETRALKKIKNAKKPKRRK